MARDMRASPPSVGHAATSCRRHGPAWAASRRIRTPARTRGPSAGRPGRWATSPDGVPRALVVVDAAQAGEHGLPPRERGAVIAREVLPPHQDRHELGDRRRGPLGGAVRIAGRAAAYAVHRARPRVVRICCRSARTAADATSLEPCDEAPAAASPGNVAARAVAVPAASASRQMIAMAAYFRIGSAPRRGHRPAAAQLEVAGGVGSPAGPSSPNLAEIRQAGRGGSHPLGRSVRPAHPSAMGSRAYRPCTPPPRRIIFVIAGTKPPAPVELLGGGVSHQHRDDHVEDARGRPDARPPRRAGACRRRGRARARAPRTTRAPRCAHPSARCRRRPRGCARGRSPTATPSRRASRTNASGVASSRSYSARRRGHVSARSIVGSPAEPIARWWSKSASHSGSISATSSAPPHASVDAQRRCPALEPAQPSSRVGSMRP